MQRLGALGVRERRRLPRAPYLRTGTFTYPCTVGGEATEPVDWAQAEDLGIEVGGLRVIATPDGMTAYERG